MAHHQMLSVCIRNKRQHSLETRIANEDGAHKTGRILQTAPKTSSQRFVMLSSVAFKGARLKEPEVC